MYIYIHIYIYNSYIYIYIHAHKHTHTHMHTYLRSNIHTFGGHARSITFVLYVYIYIYIHTCTSHQRWHTLFLSVIKKIISLHTCQITAASVKPTSAVVFTCMYVYMLKPEPFEFQHEYIDTDDYRTLYDRAKEVFPDITPFFIQMALLSHLEEASSHQRWHTLFLSVIKKIISLKKHIVAYKIYCI